ncbi:hypothetical protein COOONC_06603 [Cooperia oncophora]
MAYFGKPAIMVPIFGDQPRNANMYAKHGAAIVLSKSDLRYPEVLRDSLKRILYDESFTKNAKRLSEMLQNQPVNAKQLLIKHSEFAARLVEVRKDT